MEGQSYTFLSNQFFTFNIMISSSVLIHCKPEILQTDVVNHPYIQVTNLSRTIQLLKDEGFWLVGTSDNANQSLYEIDLKGKIGIVMGAEGKGLRRLTEEKCDFLAKLPMMGSVECLNVSVATGVCLYEAIRQRNLS